MGQVCPGGILYGPGHLSQALSGHKEKVIGSSLLQAAFSQPTQGPLGLAGPLLALAAPASQGDF